MSKKILIVDDEPEICELISEGLRDEGYYVSSANTGRAGTELLENKDFDLVILDIYLPDLDGTEIYETMRKMVRHHKTPVIFLTALATGTKPQLAGIHDKAYTIISKPTSLEEIQKEIKRLLG